MKNRVYFLLISCFLPIVAFSQIKLTGKLIDEMNGKPIVLAEVSFLSFTSKTNEFGVFVFEDLANQSSYLEITANGYEFYTKYIDISNEEINLQLDLGSISLKKGIDIVSLDLQEIQQQEDGGDSPLGNLSAYRDPFSDLAAFDFRQINFKRRGIDFDYQTVTINGLDMSDLEYNRPTWALWGGLNDAFRDQTNSIGINYSENQLPSLGGVTNFIIRPSQKAKLIQNSLSTTNYSYMTRLMSTYASGKGTSGWSWLVNGSLRWGDDSFFPGIFYNSASFLVSAEKEITENYSLSFTSFYSPTNRSGRTAITKEEADLAPDGKQYNPYWGNQDGEARFSRVQKSRQPFFMLSNYLIISDKVKLDANLAYRFGTYGRTRLEYYNQNDPEPNNPRYLPSNFDFGSDEYYAAKDAFRNNPNYSQINWAELYDVNLSSPEVIIPNANGGAQSFIGRRASYILQEEISADKQISSNVFLEYKPDAKTIVKGGVFLSSLNRNYYKKVNDLLGSEFWLDIDRFLEFDYPDFSAETQNDLRNTNRIVTEGDRFGYDYNIISNKWNAFIQAKQSGFPFEYNFGVALGNSSFQREGNYQKGIFPDNSLGESNIKQFLEFQSNAGFTYYLEGKKSFLINTIFQQNAPRGEWVFPQARSNNAVLPDIQSENLYGTDLTFRFINARFRMISSVYYYRKYNATERSLSLLNLDNSNLFDVDFLSVSIQNVSQQFLGFEFGANYKLTESIAFNGGMTIAEHEYRNNPTLYVANDEPLNGDQTSIFLLNGQETYLKGLNVGASPQYVFALGTEYKNPNFWFVKLSVNHFSKAFIQPNPLNRVLPILEDRLNNNPTLTAYDLIKQSEFDQGFSFNLGLGKSWRINYSSYIRLNAFINNLLNNEMQTWGFEQTNYNSSYAYFNKYSYTQGRTFFINLSLKI